MSDVETYGGKCPVCASHMLQKGDTGVGQWFSFDACPWCGFAYGEGHKDGEGHVPYTADEVWRSVLEHHRSTSRAELIVRMDLRQHEGGDSLFDPGVFVYTNISKGRMETMMQSGSPERYQDGQLHQWEATDSQGYEMECSQCDCHISIYESESWDQHFNEDCPNGTGKPQNGTEV